MDSQDQNNQIEIELPQDIAEGTYSNLAIIAHSSSEFVIDFVRVVPGVPKAKVKSRIILTPEHAKRLLHALDENIKRFETHNGTVNLQDIGGFLPPLNGSMGEA